MLFNQKVIHLKDVARMANSIDHDQTAPEVRSESTLFAQPCPSENFTSLWYFCLKITKIKTADLKMDGCNLKQYYLIRHMVNV